MESQAQGDSLAWEASPSPVGGVTFIGLPGASGQVGGADSLPASTYVAPGPTIPNTGLATIGRGQGELVPDWGASATPNSNIYSGVASPYTNGSFGTGGFSAAGARET